MADTSNPEGFRAWLAGFHPYRGPVLPLRERLCVRTMGAGLAALGPIALIQGRAVLVVFAILFAAALLRPGSPARLGAMLRSPLSWLFAALPGWILVSLLWSPGFILPWLFDALGALAAGYALLWLAGGIDPYYRRILLLAFAASLLILIAALVVEAASGGIIARLLRGQDYVSGHIVSRGAGFAVLLLYPAILAARRIAVPGQLWVAGAVLAATGAAAFALDMRAAQAAFALSLPVFLLALWRPRPVLLLLGAGIALYALLAPVISVHWFTIPALQAAGVELPSSFWHRVGVWTFASERIAEHPIAGWGFNAARWFSEQGFTVHLPIPGDPDPNALPIHTHNGILQIWLEFGLIGILLTLALLGILAAGIWRTAHDRLFAATALGAFAAAFVIFSVSFSIWRVWWLGLLFMLVMLFRWQRDLPPGSEPPHTS